jgi:hypothetical protein
MATIKDLTIYLLHRSESDAYNLIRDLRALRREMPPPPVKKVKTPKGKKAPKQLSLLESVEAMSPAQAKALLAKLQKRI